MFKTKKDLKDTITSLKKIDSFLRRPKVKEEIDTREFQFRLVDGTIKFKNKNFNSLILYENDILKNISNGNYLLTNIINKLEEHEINNTFNLERVKTDIEINCKIDNVERTLLTDYNEKISNVSCKELGGFVFPNLGSFLDTVDSNSKGLDFCIKDSYLNILSNKWKNKNPEYIKVVECNLNIDLKFYIPFSIVGLGEKKSECVIKIFEVTQPNDKGNVFKISIKLNKSKIISFTTEFLILNVPYYNE